MPPIGHSCYKLWSITYIFFASLKVPTNERPVRYCFKPYALNELCFVYLLGIFFLQDTTEVRGIKHVRIYARDIVAAADSKITFSSPNWDQQFSTPTPQTGRNGDNGENGVHGPQGEKFLPLLFLFIFNNNNIFYYLKRQRLLRGKHARRLQKCFTTCDHEQRSN